MEPGGEVRSKRPRVFELDLLRLVAAFMVVAYHYTYRFQAEGGYSPVIYPASVAAITRYGCLGVQLFFFISGVVILGSVAPGGPRSFVASRAARLFPAYWAAVTITFVVRYFWGFGLIGPVPATNYVGNLTMLQGFYGGDAVDTVYWTLTRELVFYAIVWFTLVTRQIHRVKVVLAVWLSVATAVEVVEVGGWTRTWLASNYASYFVAGACCALLTSPEGRRQRLATWFLLGASVAIAVWSALGPEVDRLERTFGPDSFNRTVVGIIVGGSFVLVLAVSSGRLRRWGRAWMAAAGLLTYPLYLLHQSIGAILFTNLSEVNRWVLLIGVTALMCGLAALLHRVVELPIGPPLRQLVSRALGIVPDWARRLQVASE